MRLPLALLLVAGTVVGCQANRGVAPDGVPLARVHNAIDFGVGTSTYFVVSRVDGVSVHRKFDRDAFVEVAAGEHRLAVRFYSEGFSQAPHGRDECSVVLTAAAATDYYIEGVVDGDRWRARVVEADRSRPVVPCRFAADATEGQVEGGTQHRAVTARPDPPAAPDSPASRPAAIPAAPVIESASPAAGAPAVAAVSAPVAAGAAAPPVVQKPSVPVDAVPATTPEAAEASAAAPLAAVATEEIPDDDEFFVVSAMRGRGHRGCRAGRYRVDGGAGEVLALSGNERVRLFGVEARSEEAYAAELEKQVGRCVEIEIDPEFSERGHHDRDGNLLAYVRDQDGDMLNVEVVRLGLATVDTALRGRYLAELLAAQSQARTAKRGIWSRPAE